MKDYDEEVLVKKFNGTNFINHLPSEKNYLYELVLKTMRAYHGTRSKSHELHNLMQDIQFLFERGFYDVAMKRVKKAKKIAYDFDRHGELLDLISWHRKLLKYIETPDLLQKNKELQEERNGVAATFQNENEILNLYEHIFLLLKENNKKHQKENKDLLKKLNQHPALVDTDRIKSFIAKHFYFISKGLLTFHIGEFVASNDYLRQGVLLWESRPDRIPENLDRYKSALQNYAIYAIAGGNDFNHAEVFQKLKTLPSNGIKEEANNFQRIYALELYYYINEADFTNASKAVMDNEERLEKYEDLIDRSGLVALYFNVASMFFVTQDFKKCIKWLHRIQNLKTDVREDIKHFAMILELIIHYETTPTVVENFYRNTSRHLNKHGSPNEFEITLLKYLKKMIAISGTDNDEVNRLLRKLQASLSDLETKEEKFIGMEELSCWIESKLRRLSMHDILKERVKLRKKLASTT